jgi:hypothetical protein
LTETSANSDIGKGDQNEPGEAVFDGTEYWLSAQSRSEERKPQQFHGVIPVTALLNPCHFAVFPLSPHRAEPVTKHA